ncbi:MAG TPA: cellulase family glycosylhydrolase [Phycisphaerae bacterium]|nr:cellulase family glycosylhydrolase [Phycisphaerae bacterium]
MRPTKTSFTVLFVPILVIQISGTCPPPDPLPLDKFTLWSDGANVRGANIYQRRVYQEVDGADFLGPGPFGPPYTQENLNQLADLGANYVNISCSGIFTEMPPYEVDAEAQANLDDLLEKAAAANLFAVISFRTGPGRSEFAIFEGQDWFPQELVLNTVWTDEAAQDGWADMWLHTAERYRDNAIVIGYDLMVEPNGASTILGIFDPADFYPAHADSLVDWNPFHARISAAIREVDDDTPILVNAMSYGSLLWLPHLIPSDDTRTVYTVHHYEPFDYTHQAAGAGPTYPGDMTIDGQTVTVDAAYLQSLLAPVEEFKNEHGVPVAINEFGVMRWAPGAALYYRDQVAAFATLDINHAVWLWESSHEPLAEADDFNFRHGPDAANHTDVDNALQDAIESEWSKNTRRPNG